MFGLGLAELLVVAILCLMIVASGRIMEVGWFNPEKRLSPKERLEFGLRLTGALLGTSIAGIAVREILRGAWGSVGEWLLLLVTVLIGGTIAWWSNPWKRS
jgi:hypothetical protein